MNFDSVNLVGLVAVTGLFLGPTIYYVAEAVASNWRKVRIAEQEAVLKKEMLDKGFGPDDIVKVLAAGGRAAPAANQPADLIGAMIDHGYDADAVTAASVAADRLPADGKADALRAAVDMASNGYDGDDIVKFLDARAAARPAVTPA